MSKLQELEAYAETATGQAKKVAILAAAAIKEARENRPAQEAEPVKSGGFVQGMRKREE
jgi:hypothetical protein